MAQPNRSLCITCGRDADEANSINRLSDGRPCPACMDRLLERVPPPFPGFGQLLDRKSANADESEDDLVLAPKPERPEKNEKRGKKGNRR